MATLIDDSGTTRFEGTITGASTAPGALLRGQFTQDGLGTSIGNNAVAPLPWGDSGLPGGPVVDLTDPTEPAVLVDGVYAVSAEVQGASMTADGFFVLTLTLDFGGDGSPVQQESRLATVAQDSPVASVSDTYFIPAGGLIRLVVRNRDGAGAITFGIDTATIQQVA